MDPDAPIHKAADDRFGYDILARQLAPNLILKQGESSLVAGVEAPWGSGKTSFLNLVRNAITELNKDALVLPYCPWIYSTADALLLGFCVQLAGELKYRDSKLFGGISSALMGLSLAMEVPGAVPGQYRAISEPVSKGLKWLANKAARRQQLESINLTNAKDKVQDAIDKAGRPIVVVTDDVDRLPPDEIRLLFQFLKAVADFNGVSYLLAYDATPVESALSFNNTLDGKEYLKKFVQLPIRLPRISRLLLQRFFRNAIERLGEELDRPFTKAESEALSAVVAMPRLDETIQTPRDVSRALNLFRLRLADCRGELALDDLLLFVTLDLTCPEAVELVRDHPGAFLTLGGRHPEFERNDPESVVETMLDDKIEDRRKNLYKSLPPKQCKSAERLIRQIFLKGEGRVMSDVREARNPQGLLKLLYGGSTPLAFSVEEARDFLRNHNRQQVIDDKATAGVLRQWLVFLSSVPDSSTPIHNPDGIAQLLIEETLNPRNDNPTESFHRLVADFLFDLLAQISDPADRLKFVQSAARQTKNLYVSERLLTKLTSMAGLWAEGVTKRRDPQPGESDSLPVSVEAIKEEQQRWLQIVRSQAETGTLHEQPHLGFILHRWGQFNNNDYSEVQRYVTRFCETNDPLIILRHFDFELDASGLGRIFVNPSAIIEQMRKYDSDEKTRSAAIQVMESLTKQSATSSASATVSECSVARPGRNDAQGAAPTPPH
jgi:predicted KAP-like P-loop ATPase